MTPYRTEIVKNTEIEGWYILRVFDSKNNIVMSTTDSLEECESEAEYWQNK